MNHRIPSITIVLTVIAITILAQGVAHPNPARALTPEDLVVVYNKRVRLSEDVARHYAARRKVPEQNLVGVQVSESEGISRAEVDRHLAPPVRDRVKKLMAEGRNPSILLIHGLPLRVTYGSQGDYPDFLIQIRLGIERSGTLCRAMAREIRLLLGESGDAPKQAAATDMPEVLRSATETLKQAVNSLQGKQLNLLTPDQKRLTSLVFRMAGTSPMADALLRRIKSSAKAGRGLSGREFLRWHTIIQEVLERDAFFGVVPENAFARAESVRIVNGAIGELRFWLNLEKLYASPKLQASLDSELSLLLVDPYQTAQWLPNPHHGRFDRLPFIQPLRDRVIKVARLDGPTPVAAKRLVDDAMAVEEEGLEGTVYIDARGLPVKGDYGSYGWYEGHLVNLYNFIKDHTKLNVVMDRTKDLFSTGACPDAAVYCGWYSRARYVDAFTWKKGAVGFHVASGEARGLRDSRSNRWCKRMIETGVAATLGSVSEPYLASFPLPDEFFPLLLTGQMPLLDVYYRTVPHVSWRQVIIGDPLYQPYKKRPAVETTTSRSYRSPDRIAAR